MRQARRNFTLFHLSLIPIRQRSFETLDLTREEWLSLVLSTSFNFSHWGGTDMVWLPKQKIGGNIFGLVQQQRSFSHHEPPELGGDETVSSVWQGAYVLLDPTTHEYGQRVAVEDDVVGKPVALLRSLFAHCNSRSERPYNIEFEQIFDGGSFWKFAASHGNVLKKVSFDFVVPNMWGTENDLEKDLKETGKQTGAETVRVDIQSKDGISVENQKIRDAVSYSEKGAGKINATALSGARFSSGRKPSKSQIPNISDDEDSARASIVENSERVLGRG